jgi:hypothetical protein
VARVACCRRDATGYVRARAGIDHREHRSKRGTVLTILLIILILLLLFGGGWGYNRRRRI